ncbi:hypothetical protein [Nesterenkonia sp.]|uniref:hypothetical protein n=1 Tax=Nesterenkonia sp. TaxID=704201 RepID=UPI002611E39B|nr:hypothetical protein [Nesterenkonia sp.]
MLGFDWEQHFESLNFFDEARLSKMALNGQLSEGDDPFLVAHTLWGSQVPVRLSDYESCWGFSLRDVNEPITEVRLHSPAGQEILRIDGLMPADDVEYERGMRLKKRRPEDPDLNFFISWQMAQYFPGSPSYRVAAAVVAVYKAVELNREEYIQAAGALLREAHQLLPTCPLARSVRKNRENLAVSLWTAEWHLLLLRGDFQGALRVWREIAVFMENTLSNYFNVVYNANKALLILCLYHAAHGEMDAVEKYADQAFTLFQNAVRDADKTLAHFKELKVPHQAAYECLVLAREKPRVGEDEAKRLFKTCKRIDAASYGPSFRKMWQTMRNGLALERE